MAAGRGALKDIVCEVVNMAVSLVVFTLLDLLDALLCLVYKVLDYIMEGEWKPCYCSSAKDMMSSGGGNILVTEDGIARILCLSSSNKLHLDDISDTLYLRPSLLSEVSSSTLRELRRMKPSPAGSTNQASSASASSSSSANTNSTVNSTIVEVLQGKIRSSHHDPRWSDCHCKTCTGWISSSSSSSSLSNSSSNNNKQRRKNVLYVHVEGPELAEENVLFIHGFISSSEFWTETVFRYFGEGTRVKYRMFAVDLLGFGRSPKPSDSLYTLREHVEMIERSVLEAYDVNSLHIVAHSLGSILALALAVNHPSSVKSLTLLSPPYFPLPEGVVKGGGAQYVLRKVAPRRVWPPMAFGASLACWYEHIGRTTCLVICKNHRIWELAIQHLTRLRTFLINVFFCHTHHAAWHTLHNIICGCAARIDSYLDSINRHLNCDVTVLHGQDDELIPVECSLALASHISRANVRILGNKDHLTIVVGRQRAFARQLEKIWSKATTIAPKSSP